jgi:hypothetical protein
LYAPIIDPTDTSADTMYVTTPGSTGVQPFGDVEWTYSGSGWIENQTLHAGSEFGTGSSTSFVPTGFGKVGGSDAIVEATTTSSGSALQLLVDDSGVWTPDTTSTELIDAGSASVSGGTLTYDGLTLVYAMLASTGDSTLYVSTRDGSGEQFPVGGPVALPASLQGVTQIVEPWLIGGDCSKLAVRVANAGSSTFYMLTP